MGCGASSSQPVGVERRHVNGSRPGNLNGAHHQNLRTTLPLPPSLPVSSPAPYRHGSPISKPQLGSLRSGFWSTRVEGSMNMWLALKSASEALLEKDVMMANAVLQASNITTPNGDLTLCYDELGDVYKVPEYCFVDPMELGQPQADRERNPSSNGLFKGFMMTPTSVKSANLSVIRVVDAPICIKIKVNPSDYLLHVDTNLISTVEELKAAIYEKTKLVREKGSFDSPMPPICEEKRQRLIFMGKELTAGQVLGDVGVDDTRVIQVFLRKEEAEPTTVAM